MWASVSYAEPKGNRILRPDSLVSLLNKFKYVTNKCISTPICRASTLRVSEPVYQGPSHSEGCGTAGSLCKGEGQSMGKSKINQ